MGKGEHPEAGVLVALTDEAEPRVLLGRRAEHLPHHPGEIAFAGGKREARDESPWVTALREAHEEVGLTESLVRSIGELPPMVTRTNFQVYPCIAAIPAEPELVIDPNEFDSVFMPRLSVFADRAIYRLEEFNIEGRRFKSPHYQVGDDNVWGVTAAILVLLANLAYDAQLEMDRDWNIKP
jgi:8-oxo-dGTP pyrophosphatase MutT (NUDIX family)